MTVLSIALALVLVLLIGVLPLITLRLITWRRAKSSIKLLLLPLMMLMERLMILMGELLILMGELLPRMLRSLSQALTTHQC